MFTYLLTYLLTYRLTCLPCLNPAVTGRKGVFARVRRSYDERCSTLLAVAAGRTQSVDSDRRTTELTTSARDSYAEESFNKQACILLTNLTFMFLLVFSIAGNRWMYCNHSLSWEIFPQKDTAVLHFIFITVVVYCYRAMHVVQSAVLLS